VPLRAIAASLLLALSGCSGPSADIPGLAAVWGIHDGEKIRPDERESPWKAQNQAWDGRRVRVFGARNEVVAFQIVVEANRAGIRGLELSLPSLALRGGGSTISYEPPAADPTDFQGRPIQIFVERSMFVAETSHADWIFVPGSAAAPRDATGYQPVQLVPENARADRGGLPIDVPPETSQAFWIELYLDRELPAGTYDGEVLLRAGGGMRAVPIELELFDFTLPDESSLPAMVFFDPTQVELYHGYGGPDLVERYHRFAHRQRIEFVGPNDEASVRAALGRFDGSDFTAARDYEGPGEGIGNHLVPRTFCSAGEHCPGPPFEGPDTAPAAADAWMRFLRATVPGAKTFLYMLDEPTEGDYARLRELVAALGPHRALPTFTTSAWAPELDGAIDVWSAPAATFDPARAAAERARGHGYGFYNGTRPQTGALVIDAPATDPRTVGWAAFAGGASEYLYWHADHWRHNAQKVGERIQDVWASPVTFDNRGQPGKAPADTGFINGDGVLIYPGEEVLHPEEDRGIAGPVSTIQLANLRRGLQDHLYLSLARARGLEREIAEALAAVVPAVLTGAGAAVGFSEHGDDYERARYTLACALKNAASR
jgi:Domain of unknown function (DUF4091)